MTGGSAPILRSASVAEVWTFDLHCDVDESVLSSDERERAERLRFPEHQARFRRRRSHLRHVLASCTGRDAQELRFVAGEYGKPALIQDPGLHFSASSSVDVAMLAVCDHEIGVDVEVVRPELADAGVARRMFTAEEAAAVAAGTAEDFFRCWTRKEAYVKAVGQGLSYPLQSFAVEVADVARPRLVRLWCDSAEWGSSVRPDDVGSWTVADLSSSASNITAALVVRSPSVHLRKRRTPAEEGSNR